MAKKRTTRKPKEPKTKTTTESTEELEVLESAYVLMGPIESENCKDAIEWILGMNSLPLEEAPTLLTLYVISPGGHLHPAIALVDIMRGSRIPIRTIGLGQIASAGLIIFMAGHKGLRQLTEYTSVMSHQYAADGGAGKHHEIMASVKEHQMTHEKLISIYQKFSGMKRKVITDTLMSHSDFFMTAQEAKDYGICDYVGPL